MCRVIDSASATSNTDVVLEARPCPEMRFPGSSTGRRAIDIGPRAVRDGRPTGAPSPLGHLTETLLRAERLTAAVAGGRVCSPRESAGTRPLSSAILWATIVFKGFDYGRGDKGANPPESHSISLPWYPLHAHEYIASRRVISLGQFVIFVGDIVPPYFDQPIGRQRPGHK